MPYNGVRRKPPEQPLLDHHLAAARHLLGGLEDEMHGAVEPARRGQVARGAEQHRGVPIVTASVHAPLIVGAVCELVELGERQAVHVGAQADTAPARARAQRANDAGACQPPRDFDAACRELARDDVGGARLCERELRVPMQVATDGRQRRRQRGERCGNAHLMRLPAVLIHPVRS